MNLLSLLFTIMTSYIVCTIQMANEQNTRVKRQISETASKWPNNVVNYELDVKLKTRTKTAVISTIEYIEQNTCITFTKTSSAANRIKIISEKSCYSDIGMIGGVQNLSLGTGCNMRGTITRHLFYALGVQNMHQRPDRDTYVTIDLSSVDSTARNKYTKLSDSVQLTPYEYGSAMHFAADHYPASNKLTMKPKDDRYLHTIGSEIVSITDLEMINKFYGCDSKCSPDTSAVCENKGFPNPADCSKCICPLGYGGNLCNQIPADFCGETLTAEDNWQTINKKMDGNPNNIPYQMCTYWIVTADNSYDIQVEITGLKDHLCVYGCAFNGFELKTRDQKETNPRVCCPQFFNEVQTSSLNPTPVILYNTYTGIEGNFQYRRVLAATTTAKPSSTTTTTTTTTSTRTTSLTTTSTAPKILCTDVAGTEECAAQKLKGFCSEETPFEVRKMNCAVTCGLCGQRYTPCVDTGPTCETFVKNGFCFKDPLLYEYNCARSCGYCDNPV